MLEIDARGLACPAPVLKTKDAIEKNQPDVLQIIVDNEAAKQNVSRFLSTKRYEASVEQKGSDFWVTGRKDTAGDDALSEQKAPTVGSESDHKKIMVMITTDRMGFGDDELGLKLMVSFVKTVQEMTPDLWRLVFVNNGVKLTIGGSEVLDVLKEYEKSGISILVCGTCLTHFGLLDQKEVGETTNMLDIVTSMQLADNVINI